MSSLAKTKVNDEIQITHEDQKMINAFANKNAKNNEAKMSIANKKKELQNLEDASDELMLLDDSDGTVPIHIGEVFLSMSMDDAQVFIDECKEKIEQDVKTIEQNITSYAKELKDLKVKLYAKFGNNINLEEEEEEE